MPAPKKPWAPAELAHALSYATPSYSNLFPANPVGSLPQYHTGQEVYDAKMSRTVPVDAANTALYDDWNTKYNAALAERDAKDAADRAAYEKSVGEFNTASDYFFGTGGTTNPAAGMGEYAAPLFEGRSRYSFDNEGGAARWSPHGWTAPQYGPNYTQRQPANYSSAVRLPPSLEGFKAFGKNIQPHDWLTSRQPVGPTPPSLPNTGPVANPARATPGAGRARPNYIGAGFLNAKPIKAPGT